MMSTSVVVSEKTVQRYITPPYALVDASQKP